MKYLTKFISAIVLSVSVCFLFLPICGQEQKAYDIKMELKPQTLIWDGEKPLYVEVTLKNVGNIDAKLDMRCRGAFSFYLESKKEYERRLSPNGVVSISYHNLRYSGEMLLNNKVRKDCHLPKGKWAFDTLKVGESRTYTVNTELENPRSYSDLWEGDKKLTWENRPDGEYELEVRYMVGGKTGAYKEELLGTVASGYTKIQLKRKPECPPMSKP